MTPHWKYRSIFWDDLNFEPNRSHQKLAFFPHVFRCTAWACLWALSKRNTATGLCGYPLHESARPDQGIWRISWSELKGACLQLKCPKNHLCLGWIPTHASKHLWGEPSLLTPTFLQIHFAEVSFFPCVPYFQCLGKFSSMGRSEYMRKKMLIWSASLRCIPFPWLFLPVSLFSGLLDSPEPFTALMGEEKSAHNSGNNDLKNTDNGIKFPEML